MWPSWVYITFQVKNALSFDKSSANGCTVFIGTMCSHWIKLLRQRHAVTSVLQVPAMRGVLNAELYLAQRLTLNMLKYFEETQNTFP